MHHIKESKGILSSHNNMNLYRGCTHGCIYCDSRSKCYQMEHDFEDIEVKINAPELLEQTLKKKRKKCMITTGAMTDPYISIEVEENFRLTQKCLEIINKYGFGLAIHTKSDRILCDIDLLKSINKKSKCVVQMTLTTYDEKICEIIEPNVCTTKERAEVLKTLNMHGIPTVVWLTPLLPFINDTEENLSGILNLCFEAKVYGIISFGITLTLREGNREYYYKKLDEHFPNLKQIYQKKYGYSYEIISDNNDKLMKIFHSRCETLGIKHNNDEIFRFMHTFPDIANFGQLSLFD